MRETGKQLKAIRVILREKGEIEAFRETRKSLVEELGQKEGRKALLEQYKHILPVEPVA